MKARDLDIPCEITGILGPITIGWAAELKDENGDELCGSWDALQRRITLVAGFEIHVTLFYYFHERVHAMLDDMCVILPKEIEEKVCDGIAANLVFGVLAGTDELGARRDWRQQADGM